MFDQCFTEYHPSMSPFTAMARPLKPKTECANSISLVLIYHLEVHVLPTVTSGTTQVERPQAPHSCHTWCHIIL